MGFFHRGYGIGYGEIVHLLHSSYSIDFVMKSKLASINKIIDSALIRQEEALIMDLWKGMYPYMQLGWLKLTTYEDYKRKLLSTERTFSEKSAEEIENEMLDVIAQYEANRQHL